MSGTLDDALLASFRGDMLRFARLQLRDEALAEDVVQESLLAAFGALDSFAGRSSAKTWLFSILRNKIIDALRSRAKTINVSALGAEAEAFDETFDALFKANAHWMPALRPTDWGDPERSLHDRQFWDVFDVCLTHLPENTGRVFMMREFLELDTEDICAELRISTANCHVILHRARNLLRRCLERTWFGQGGYSC